MRWSPRQFRVAICALEANQQWLRSAGAVSILSREPLSKMAVGLVVAFASFVAGLMSVGMLIGMLAFSSGK